MGTPFSNTRRVTSRSFSQFFPPFLRPVPLRPASPSLPPTSALLDSTTEPSQDHMEHMLPPTHHMLMLGLHTDHLSQPSMLDHSLLDQLLLLPQSPLPPMLLLQLLLLLLLLLLVLLDLFLPSSRLRMNLEMLLMDARTSTVPSRNVAMPWVVSLDLTPMLMRLESTLSTILLMTLDSVWLVTTFQSPQSTLECLPLPQSTTELLLFLFLTHLRLLLPRLASLRLSMLPLRSRDPLMPMLTTTHMLLLLMLPQHMLLPQLSLPMLLPPMLLPQLLLLMLLPPMLLPQLLLLMPLPPMLLPQLLLPMHQPPMLLPQLLLLMHLLPMLLPLQSMPLHQLPMLLPQLLMLLPQLLLLLLHVRLSSPPSSSTLATLSLTVWTKKLLRNSFLLLSLLRVLNIVGAHFIK